MARRTTTTPAPETTEATAPETTEATPADAQGIPAFVDLPAKPAGGGSSGPSVWADRLNPIADHQDANPGKYAPIFETKQPKGATVMASDLRRKLRKGAINGVVGGPYSFDITTRGTVLFARYLSDDEAAKAQAAYEAKEAARNGDSDDVAAKGAEAVTTEA